MLATCLTAGKSGAGGADLGCSKSCLVRTADVLAGRVAGGVADRVTGRVAGWQCAVSDQAALGPRGRVFAVWHANGRQKPVARWLHGGPIAAKDTEPGAVAGGVCIGG